MDINKLKNLVDALALEIRQFKEAECGRSGDNWWWDDYIPLRDELFKSGAPKRKRFTNHS